MTIEERIHNTLEEELKKVPDDERNDIRSMLYNGIEDAIVGACKEQQEIDIRRAVEILKETGYFKDEEFSEEVMIDQFIKAMKGGTK